MFCSVCFFFLTRNYIYYTSVSCVWFLITVRELANITERENLHNNVNYGAWHVHKLLSGSSVATCQLACFEISLLSNEKS